MSLKISEGFYGLQGEGISIGTPAYFIRLAGCNLMCGGIGGKLLKEGKATWWCDSENIWKASKEYTSNDLFDEIQSKADINDVLSGSIHMVWTGGEPTLENHQKGIVDFLKLIDIKYPYNSIINEIETNGTNIICEDLFKRLHQINCSPKLSNSGISSDMRINKTTILQINSHSNGWFKFVVSNEDDVNEAIKDFINPFNIPKNKIILMPGADNREDLIKLNPIISDLARKYVYKCITRQHIVCWDKRTGV